MGKNGKPFLSFCIPTYNRADMVVECVNIILQYKGNDIEVVVSDNSSNDNTFEKLKSIKDDRLKVFSNKLNVGYTRNLIKVLSCANGEYCFTLSDEDRIISGSVPNILKLIRNSSYGLILTSVKKRNLYSGKVNNIKLKHLVKKIIKPLYHYIRYGKNLSAYYIYHKKNIDDKVEVIKKIYSYTYLSGLIIEKKLIPFDRISSTSCIDLNVYPQVFIMLIVNDRSSTYFSGDAFTVMNEIPLKSHIIDEKKPTTQSYPHPLARMGQMLSSFRWLDELDLTEEERINVTFFMFESFLKSARRGFYNYTSENEKKVSDKGFEKISYQLHKKIKAKLPEFNKNRQISEYIIASVREFIELTINIA